MLAEEKVCCRRARARARGTRTQMTVPQAPNHRRSIDFLSDCFADSRRFRIFAVAHEFTRECLDLFADTSPSGALRSGMAARRQLGGPNPIPNVLRHRIDEHGDPEMVSGGPGGMAPHCTWQARPEGHYRKLQQLAA